MGLFDRVKFLARCHLNSWKEKLTGERDIEFVDPEIHFVDDDDDFAGLDIDEAEIEEELRRAKKKEESIGQKFSRYKSRLYQKRGEPTLEQCYENLEVTFGASVSDARLGLRKLMKKYHPDRYPNDPEQQKSATKIAQKLTESFEIIKRYHEKTLP